MSQAPIDAFFLEPGRLEKMERAYSLLSETVDYAIERLQSDLLRIFQEIVTTTGGKWEYWESDDGKHIWYGLIMPGGDKKVGPALYVCGTKRDFLSAEAWIGVWSMRPKAANTTKLVSAAEKLLGESIPAQVGDPYWVHAPGWPDVSLQPGQFSILGLGPLLADPNKLPAAIKRMLLTIIESAK